MTVAIQKESTFKKVGKSILGFVKENPTFFAVATVGGIASVKFGLGVACMVVGFSCFPVFSYNLIKDNKKKIILYGGTILLSSLGLMNIGSSLYDVNLVNLEEKLAIEKLIKTGKKTNKVIVVGKDYTYSWGKDIKETIFVKELCRDNDTVVVENGGKVSYYSIKKNDKGKVISFRPLSPRIATDYKSYSCSPN